MEIIHYYIIFINNLFIRGDRGKQVPGSPAPLTKKGSATTVATRILRDSTQQSRLEGRPPQVNLAQRQRVAPNGRRPREPALLRWPHG